MYVGKVVLPYAAGKVWEFCPQKLEHCAGAGAAACARMPFGVTAAGAASGWTLRLCGRRSLAGSSRPVTARMSGLTEDGTETGFDGAFRFLPRQLYVWTAVPNALLIAATVPLA